MDKELTTNDIFKELSKDQFTKLTFLGVFPRDRLPNIFKYPASIVINTDPSYKVGEHWLALYFNDKRECEFFDSYGYHPDYYGLLGYIKKFSSDFKFNNQRLQADLSSTCGHYCIYFLLLKNRHFELHDVIDLFSKDNFDLNDFKIQHII